MSNPSLPRDLPDNNRPSLEQHQDHRSSDEESPPTPNDEKGPDPAQPQPQQPQQQPHQEAPQRVQPPQADPANSSPPTAPPPAAAATVTYPFPYRGRRIASTTGQIYHEKQAQQHCAVHTVNNIIQFPAYTNACFDRIAKEMSPKSWVNPHKSIFGTGNYDANVLLYALGVKTGLQTTWYNKRAKTPLNRLDSSKLAGIIVNVITSSFLWWEQRHWIPLVPIISGDVSVLGQFDGRGTAGAAVEATNPATPSGPNHAQQQRRPQREGEGQGESDQDDEPRTAPTTTPPQYQVWFNLNPLFSRPQKIDLVEHLGSLLKRDSEAIIIFVLLPGVEDAKEIWMDESDPRVLV